MSREEYNFRNTTTSIDDANSIVQQLGLSKYRSNYAKNV